MRNILLALVLVTIPYLLPAQARAQENQRPISTCQAVAQNSVPVIKASASVQYAQALEPSEIRITYVGHSTFRIEDANGLVIATDYAGFAGLGVVPDVVTMNHAHHTHFTISPDPRIRHVLRGWGKPGSPAKHYLQVGDALIRNVTTDIDNAFAGYEPNGNSIFIFEMGGLCIGHLGHLHHLPNDSQYAQIGRLDILMIPVDGGVTLNAQDMTKVVRRLNASVVLTMHAFGEFSLQQFLANMGEGFPIERTGASSATYSLNTLPTMPTVVVLKPESPLVVE
ncbi:MAG: MBL fold metallo-hydrolase [Pseudomonadota bacterium]